MTLSACCHAPIKAHMPNASFYSQSPPDPVPYCVQCKREWPDEIEETDEQEIKIAKN